MIVVVMVVMVGGDGAMMQCMLDVRVGVVVRMVGVGRIVPVVPVVTILPPRCPYETPPVVSGEHDASYQTTRSHKPRYHTDLRRFRRYLGVPLQLLCQ